MVDKFWLRYGLLACGVLTAATVPAYAEPATSPTPIGQVAQALAISGTDTGTKPGWQGGRNRYIVCVRSGDEWSTDASGDCTGDEERFALCVSAR
jgi:hypothetical protein